MSAPKRYDIEFLKSIYIAGDRTLASMGREFGISPAYLGRLSSNGDWGRLRKLNLEKMKALEAENVLVKMDEALVEQRESLPVESKEHLQRSTQCGDKLGTMIQTGLNALKMGDWRELRSATETWRTWDEHMRKIHRLDDTAAKTLININVMSALPAKNKLTTPVVIAQDPLEVQPLPHTS